MIRGATIQDVPAILEIYNDVIENSTAIYTYKPNTLEMQTEWFLQKEKDGYPVFVYDIEGKVAGFATYSAFRAWPAYKYSVEHSIHIHPDFRRQGIASKLMPVLMNHAALAGYKTLIAGIDATNEGSKVLHEKLGFEYVGTMKKVGYKFNQWLDLAFYQKEFEGPKQPIEE